MYIILSFCCVNTLPQENGWTASSGNNTTVGKEPIYRQENTKRQVPAVTIPQKWKPLSDIFRFQTTIGLWESLSYRREMYPLRLSDSFTEYYDREKERWVLTDADCCCENVDFDIYDIPTQFFHKSFDTIIPIVI